MRDVLEAIVFGHKLGRTNNEIHKADLTCAPAVHAVCLCKPGNKLLCVLNLSAHKHPVPGNKYVIKDDKAGLSLPVYGISNMLYILSILPFHAERVILGHVSDTFSPIGYHKGKCIIFLTCPARHPGQNQGFIRCIGPGRMLFGALDHNAISPFFHNMHIGIRILLKGAFTAIPFCIRDRSTHNQIIFLGIPQVFIKPLVVFCPLILVYLPCCSCQRWQHFIARTPVVTCTQFLTAQAGHYQAFLKILIALMNM